MKSVIKTVLDGDWADLKQHIENKAATIIKSKIDDKKVDVLANLNGITREQMDEVMTITTDSK